MDALKSLFSSDHGLLAIVIVVAGTVLVGLGKMTTDQWSTFVEWVFGIFGGTHSLTSLAGVLTPKAVAPVASATPEAKKE